jgi:alpha-glucan,water dikinase
MNKTETINTRSGFQLVVETRAGEDQLEVSIRAPSGKPCLLHWGVRGQSEQKWRTPPESLWPAGSHSAGQNALQTPLAKQNGHASLVIRLQPPGNYAFLDFVLYFPEDKRWDNNNGKNYQIALSPAPAPEVSVLETLKEQTSGQQVVFERAFEVEGQWELAATVTKAEARYVLYLLSNVPGALFLHWGVARRSPHEWLLPPESLRGAKTTLWQNHTAQTPFERQGALNTLRLELLEEEAPLGLQFVLKQQEDGGRWFKHRGGNFYVPIRSGATPASISDAGSFSELADEIIRAEMTHNSWTLMHRYNLCHELLDRVRNDLEGQALIYVWLRFSAIRQLTWQRNYNTKPRELAHAQDRLTQKLAEIYRAEPLTRPLARLSLATVGRGGEGQRIRDEILNIMHRHHLKEVSGHFLEEWHQKLHNNNTPDDVVICEAYLEFLRTNGDVGRFYQTLQAGGVTRERLESFERPIRSQPQFVPHLKDGLLHDFSNFLKILKASHSGTDLETAVNAARNQIEGELQGNLGFLWDHRNDPGVSLVEMVSRITVARQRLSNLLTSREGIRELLYLDLALEEFLRRLVERNIHLRLEGEQLAELIARVLENVTLSYEDPELAACSRHWERLQSQLRFGAAWSLHAKSVVDRIGRALSAWIDRFYQLLQPKAEYLGNGFHAEAWTIQLFSEAVVRGNSLGFVLSILLRHLDPRLRQAANLGPWQIVSRGSGAGKIEVLESLRAVQGRRFEGPTVIIADQVMGDEDLPDNVTAVLAPNVTDIVSHVAVRARNANVLFASCLDPELFQQLKGKRGRFVELEVNAAGDVVLKEGAASVPASAPRRSPPRTTAGTARKFTRYAVTLAEFNQQCVGGKSLHQAELRGQLPDWINLPASVALPFGVFEKVLSSAPNREAAKRCEELAAKADTDASGSAALSTLRETILSLSAPDELRAALREDMASSDLPWPDDWERAWHCIKRVWASKWNERAWLSRRRMGLPHNQLYMAVLVQQVVPADYAFVLHTVNPANGNRQELFAEVVLGLGEVLVGNYPGRALSFAWNKAAAQAAFLSYPSKSTALYGGGLIFRSDSNGEDLEGFAGAGLYDSVLLEEPRQTLLDYTQEPLVWDENFRHGVAAAIARAGLAVERVCGSPQDVEGVISHGEYYVVQTRPQVGLGTEI